MAQARKEFETWLGPVEFRSPHTPLLFNLGMRAKNNVAVNMVLPLPDLPKNK